MAGSARSKGCFRCRAMKVKCGEEKPYCLRCRSRGIVCPGYRPANELVIVDMTALVERKFVKKRSKNISRSSVLDPDHLPKWKTPASINDPVTSLDIPTPLYLSPTQFDWEQLALCRFLSDYTLETPDIRCSPGVLGDLRNLCATAPAEDQVLLHSIRAVSLAYFSTQSRSKQHLANARSSYGTALGHIHAALTRGKLKDDSTLTSILLLNVYDMFAGDAAKRSPWQTHAAILSMLLQERGTCFQFSDPKIGSIARGAHRCIMFKNLLTRTAPGPETILFESAIPQEAHWGATNFASSRIARLLPLADAALAADPLLPDSRHQVRYIIEQLCLEDYRFVDWYGTRKAWLHQDGITLRLHKDFLVTGFVDVYRAARLILLETLLTLVRRASLYCDFDDFLPSQTQTQMSIHKMVDEISSSTSEVLERLKVSWDDRTPHDGKAIAGYHCVFPLKVALSVKTLTDEQRAGILEQLSFMEQTLGLRQASQV